jgi:hypothetical protein
MVPKVGQSATGTGIWKLVPWNVERVKTLVPQQSAKRCQIP